MFQFGDKPILVSPPFLNQLECFMNNSISHVVHMSLFARQMGVAKFIGPLFNEGLSPSAASERVVVSWSACRKKGCATQRGLWLQKSVKCSLMVK
jgi:hypothetical protein